MDANIKYSDDAQFDAVCQSNGWKRTSQRRAVFEYVRDNHEHPSVETVWNQIRNRLPDISLDSVYRILDDFTAVGILRRLSTEKVIRYDSRTSDHGHFVCSQCGRMYDFEQQKASAETALAACRAFGNPESVEVSVRGVCGVCQGVE